MFILPKCGGLIGEGMGEVSLTLRTNIQKRFPKKIGLQVALNAEILMEHKSVLTTGIILMPISLLIALILPGNKTLPLGDLPALISQVGIIVLVCRGNVFRSVIAGIPLVIGYLLIATNLAPLITRLAEQVGAPGPDGVLITALTDGGNPIRYWGYMLFQGNIVAFSIIPVVLVLMILSRKRYLAGLKQEATETL
jgi:PTS system galactitol-specific IIC component